MLNYSFIILTDAFSTLGFVITYNFNKKYVNNKLSGKNQRIKLVDCRSIKKLLLW